MWIVPNKMNYFHCWWGCDLVRKFWEKIAKCINKITSLNKPVALEFMLLNVQSDQVCSRTNMDLVSILWTAAELTWPPDENLRNLWCCPFCIKYLGLVCHGQNSFCNNSTRCWLGLPQICSNLFFCFTLLNRKLYTRLESLLSKISGFLCSAFML